MAFIAVRVPSIAGRSYPPSLSGLLHPEGIPIGMESDLAHPLRNKHDVDEVVFACSDVRHAHVMHLASFALTAGAGFILHGPRATMLRAVRAVVVVLPGISKCVVRTRYDIAEAETASLDAAVDALLAARGVLSA